MQNKSSDKGEEHKMTVLQRTLKNHLELAEAATFRDTAFNSSRILKKAKTVAQIAAIGIASVFIAYMFFSLLTILD